jgi:hypothetical protein
MQLISDFGSIYDKESEGYTTLNYSIGDSNFDKYLVYSSFSF